MTILSICNHKGGTGKTTSAIHIAAALGLSGRKVLVVDLDPQGFLTHTVGVDEPDPAHSSLALFDLTANLAQIPFVSLSGFDLLPSSSQLTRHMRTLNKPTDVLYVKELLKTVPQGYDVVLLDTAAAVTVYSLNALVASRFCVIPVTPEPQPTLGGEQTFQTVRMVQSKLNPNLTDPVFLFTQVDGRKANHNAYQEMLRKNYSPLVMQSVIRTSTALAQTYPGGRTVFDVDVTSRGASDYALAVDELLHLIAAGGMKTDVRGREEHLFGTL